MSGTQPDADERRIRSILREYVDGPNAQPELPAAPTALPAGYQPKPARPPDWLDDILNSTTPPAPVEPAAEPEQAVENPSAKDDEPSGSVWWQAQPDYYPRPHLPAALAHVPERAEAAISPGTRRLLYNASAAAMGWGLGLYQQFTDALTDCGTNYSIAGALVLGTGGTLLIAHVWDRRTRHWWPGIAWVARIPLATAVLALALWAPAAS